MKRLENLLLKIKETISDINELSSSDLKTYRELKNLKSNIFKLSSLTDEAIFEENLIN